MLTVLLGTANPSKIEIFRSILAEVPVHLLSPLDLGISLSVSEDGATVEENAVLKASAYHAASHLPTFAVDAALTIDGLSAADQPGLFVRRIYHATNGSGEVSDEEMLQHYIAAIQHLGGRGELVRVRAGYGRNYLLPRGLAVQATPSNLKQIEQQRKALLKRETALKATADQQAEIVRGVTLEFARLAGEQGTLFGSVTSIDLAEALAAKGFEIDRKRIQLKDPIKEIGEYEVPVKLHREVTAGLKVIVKKEAENSGQ